VAITPKALARSNAATSSATLYTVPAATTTVVTNIAIVNGAATSQTFTITLDGVNFAKTASVAANNTTFIDCKQVLDTTKVIAAFGSTTEMSFHICGIEIT
jgi:hypothetical protein